MVRIPIEICKKEFLTRFGTKASIIPLVFTLAIPVIAFLPQIFTLFTSSENDSHLVAMLFFLIIPVMVTNIFGISAFINEIRWKTIKTLLIAPIDMGQLYIGKSLACILAGVVTDFLLTIFLVSGGVELTLSNIMLFLILGPLTITFTTFILIIGSSKYPKLAENGGGIYFSIFSLIVVFLLLILLQFLVNNRQELVDSLFILIIGTLSLIAYFYAKKMFNTENLATSW